MIKAVARERLVGRYGTTIGATVLLMLIQIIISDVIVLMVNPDNIITYIVYLFTVLLVDILFGVFSSGVAFLYMNVVYGQPVRTGDVFHGITAHPDKAIVIQLPFALAAAVQTIPISIIRNFMPKSAITPAYAGLLFVALIGTVISIAVKLVFSQSFYLLQDFPDKSAGEILRISASLMKGNKWRLAKLYLSFIPLFILGIVTLFIPMLWVDSYLESSLAAFYQECIVSANRSEQ